MTAINVDHINPFLTASIKIFSEMCYLSPRVGEPYIKDPILLDNNMVIFIGFTGKIKGQVMISFDNSIACDIASKMIMMPITTMDELSISALCELGNMILGNTATIFSTKGIEIDITPPTVGRGTMAFSNNFARSICVPIKYDDNKSFEIIIAIKGD